MSQRTLAWTPPGDNWRVSETGPDHRKWIRVATAPDRNGVLRTNIIVEISSGMNVNVNGAWIPAHPEIIPTADGALCRGARHEVLLAPNLKTRAAVQVLRPDDKWLKINVLALAYEDSASGRTVYLAQIKNCHGTIVSSNSVTYHDAFDSILASVTYEYDASGFRQNVILKRRPKLSPEDYGMNSATTKLIVVSEVLDSEGPERVELPAPARPNRSTTPSNSTLAATNNTPPAQRALVSTPRHNS
jgi:hypothetical protein